MCTIIGSPHRRGHVSALGHFQRVRKVFLGLIRLASGIKAPMVGAESLNRKGASTATPRIQGETRCSFLKCRVGIYLCFAFLHCLFATATHAAPYIMFN